MSPPGSKFNKFTILFSTQHIGLSVIPNLEHKSPETGALFAKIGRRQAWIITIDGNIRIA